MYLIGVIGMMVYAATDLVTLYVMRHYLQDTTAMQHNPQCAGLAAAGRAR